jgi:hypothetical protein
MHDAHILRRADLTYLARGVADGMCTALLGLSNMGKSAVLRTLSEAGLPERLGLDSSGASVYCYVDCNRMLEMSAQGFYEVVLRALLTALPGPNPPTPLSLIEARTLPSPYRSDEDEGDDLLHRIHACYREVLAERSVASPFRVALNFNEALETAAQGIGRLALLFDEFDETLATLDARVFLNLRALYDEFDGGLCYVTATTRPLEQIRSGDQTAEFSELFEGRAYWLPMLSPDDARVLAAEYTSRSGVQLDDEELGFIVAEAGGHAGLLHAAASALLRSSAGATGAQARSTLQWLAHRLQEDDMVRNECVKLWRQLTPTEQEALLAFLYSPDSPDALSPSAEPSENGHEGGATPSLMSLRDKGILVGAPPRVFSQLFEAYARRRGAAQNPGQGVRIDVEAGEVTVDGRPAPTLTDLEYRLLLLLYGRMDKLCDKYQIVEAVWGQEYIDEVDDARIEKLVSRLRSKLEPDPANPRYLLTLRGRGYKLIRG